MAVVSMKQLLEAGVHFGHQTKRWNPKMKQYIFGARNGIYIIDLQKTLAHFREVAEFVTELGREGRRLLFVGTKRQAQEVIAELAKEKKIEGIAEIRRGLELYPSPLVKPWSRSLLAEALAPPGATAYRGGRVTVSCYSAEVEGVQARLVEGHRDFFHRDRPGPAHLDVELDGLQERPGEPEDHDARPDQHEGGGRPESAGQAAHQARIGGGRVPEGEQQRRDGVLQILSKFAGSSDILHQEATARFQRSVDSVEHVLGFGLVVNRVEGRDQIKRLCFGLAVEMRQIAHFEPDIRQASRPSIFPGLRQSTLGQVVADKY